MQNRVQGGRVLALIALAWLAAGCFETETALGPVEQALVDPRLVGDWETTSDGDTIQFTVRNFNGREFYVEQRQAGQGGQETIRYAAHVTEVKGASFVHLRTLADDGTLAKKHVILRVDRAGDGKVNLRQLDKDFFADKPHDTTERLRALVEQNLDNASMYAGDPIVLTRETR